MSERHTILVIEDDPATAEVLEDLCRSIDCVPRRAMTLAEARVAIADGGYCAVLLDIQIPADEHSRPMVGSGETALALLRAKSKRRNDDGHHVLPVLAVTGYSASPDFVSKFFKAGVDDFVSKTFDDGSGRSFAERLDSVLDKIRSALAQAGRRDHAGCAALEGRVAAAAPVSVPAVLIEIGAEVGFRSMIVRINGQATPLQPAKFLTFLHLALAHERDPEAWLTLTEAGMARTRAAPTRIREALNEVLPAELDVLETKYGGYCRILRTAVVHIDRAALAEHPDERVRKLLAARGKRPTRTA